MGADNYAGSGVLIPLGEIILNTVRADNYHILLKLFSEYSDEHKNSEYTTPSEFASSIDFSEVQSFIDFIEELVPLIKSAIEGNYIEEDHPITDILGSFFHAINCGFPNHLSLKMFEYSTSNDVPHNVEEGVIYLNFTAESCLSYSLTNEGKQLSKFSSKAPELSIWASYG